MTVYLWHLTSVWGQARVQGGCQCRLHGRCLDRKQYKWGVTTKTEASKKWFENAQSQYNSSVFWSLSCLRLDDNHNNLIVRTLCWESDRSCCSLYFRRDNEISAWGLSSVMLPAYCLTQGWPNVQWLWLLAASECTVFISWVQSPLLTQDWPHTPPASDYQCPISDIPSFIKALCVWATLPPCPHIRQSSQSDCSSPSGR